MTFKCIRTETGLDFPAQVLTCKSSVFDGEKVKYQKKHLAISQMRTPFEELITITIVESVWYSMKTLLNSEATVNNLTHFKCSVLTQNIRRDTYMYGNVSIPSEKDNSWKKSTFNVHQRENFKEHIHNFYSNFFLPSKDKETDQGLLTSKSSK